MSNQTARASDSVPHQPVDPTLSFQYDREADILHIDTRPPYPEQESQELEDEIIARLNPESSDVENLEVLFFSTRLLREELFSMPLSARLTLQPQI